MANELISEYIDEGAIKRQTDFFISQLENISKKFDALEGREISLKGASSSKEVIESIKATAAANRELLKSQEDLAKGAIIAEKANQAQLRTQKEREKFSQEQIKTEQQLAKAQQEKIKIEQQNEKLSQSELRTQQQRIAESNKAIAAAQKEAKVVADEANVYKQLSKQYNDAALAAKNLALQQGANSPVAKAAAIEAKALGDRLKDLDASVGQNQRNVGNYAQAISNSFGKAFGVIRQIAYIVPGLGIAGVFDLIIQGGVALYEMFTKNKKATEEASKALERYKENLKSANEEVSAEVSKIELIIGAIKSETLSKNERINAINELKKINPVYFGQLDTEKSKIYDIELAYRKYTHSIIQSIEARVKEKELTEIVSKRLELQKQLNLVTRGGAEMQSKLGDDLYAEYLQFGRIFSLNKDERIKAGPIVAEFVKQLEKEKATVGGLSKNYTLLKTASDKPLKATKEKDIKTIADAVDELNKELTAIGEQQDLGRIAPKEADINRVKAYDKAFEDIFKRGGNANTPIVQKLSLELDPIEQRVLQQQLREFANKTFSPDKVLAPAQSTMKQYFGIYKSYAQDEAKLYDEISQRQLVVLQTKEALKKAEVTKNYASGKISKTEYENEILNITNEYGRKGFAIQVEWLQREIDVLQVGTKAREDAEKKLADLKILLNKKVLTDDQTHFQQRAQILENFFQKAQGYANQITDIIGGVINNSVTNQKNVNQELDDQRQRTFENDVARINASSDTEQVKADKIKLLEAQRQAQKEKLERDNRKLDLERARFEKAQTITNVILGTTIAVLHQLATGDPFTAFARAIAVGAIGAAQLAVAIAAPLPRFFRGKNAGDNYEGNAWVDDGGRIEPILREDGTLEMSNSATPRITHVKRNDIIFPSIEALRNRVAMSQTDRVLSNGILVQSNSIDLKPLEKKLDGVIYAYNSRPVNETVWTERGVITRVKNGFSETEYINKYVRGL